MRAFFDRLFNTQRYQRREVNDFMAAHPNLLIIVADPKDDGIFAGYKDKRAGGRVKSATGKKPHIVHDVLHSAGFERSIDDYLVGLAEVLGVRRLKHMSQFGLVLDGLLFNFANPARKNATPSQPIPSPITRESIARKMG